MRMKPGLQLGGRYRLDDRIATGGVGEVWKATDEWSDRWVAIKVLRDRHVGDAGFRERFRAEAHHMGALAHPGLAEVFDYVEDGTLAYLVMEYLSGDPLSALLRGGRELGSRLTLGIVGQIAVTLQTAHDAGVVHRDIKPDNLIIGRDGRVKVTDFGIARGADMATLTQPGVVLGTAVYMSPEQAEAQRVTAATDIYSLGVVCYECLAGRVPFLGSTPVEIAFGHVRESPPPLPAYVPRALRDLVSQCLAKSPGQRPASMAEVAEIAYSIAQTLRPAAAPATPFASRVGDPRRIPQRGRHRAAPRRRHRPEAPACPAPGGPGQRRAAAGRRLLAPAATLGAVARPVLAPHPVRRRAVVASLAGTTVLASGLVLGAQIGVPPAAPFSGAEVSASPTPDETRRDAGGARPLPAVSPPHTDAPAAQRGADRTTGSPGASRTETPTPSATESSRAARPAPSRNLDRPTPTTTPGETPSPAPTKNLVGGPSLSRTADAPGSPASSGADRSPRTTAARTTAARTTDPRGSVAPTGTRPPSGTPSLTGTPSPSATPTGTSPSQDLLDLGLLEVTVDAADGPATSSATPSSSR